MTMFVDSDPLALSAVAAHRYTQAQAPAQAPVHGQGQERRQEQEQEPSPLSSHSPSDEVQSPIKPDGSPKKRKRTRKAATGKKFECKHKGCGKSYSRAEHLYRHQLNHSPKQIYRCEFPNCFRTFVRQDLCIRHQERHNTHGSQLQKRDHVATQGSGAGSSPSTRDTSGNPASISQQASEARSPAGSIPSRSQIAEQAVNGAGSTGFIAVQGYATSNMAGAGAAAGGGSDLHGGPLQTPQNAYHKGNTDSIRRQSDGNTGGYLVPQQKPQPVAVYGEPNCSSYEPYTHTNNNTHNNTPQPFSISPLAGPQEIGPGTSIASDSMQSRQQSISSPAGNHTVSPFGMPSGMLANGMATNTYMPQNQNMPMPAVLPGSGYTGAVLSRSHSQSSSGANLASTLSQMTSLPTSMHSEASVANMDSIGPYALPVFGSEILNRSPFALTDDFTAWLFNESSNTSSAAGFPAVSTIMPNYLDTFSGQIQNPYYPTDSTAVSGYGTGTLQQQQQQQQHHPMSVTSILDSSPPYSVISEEKRSELLDLMQTRFNEIGCGSVKSRKETFMEGNMDADNHILSLRMMQTYISSYWYHCHAQLPILHKHTFTPDKTPNILLFAVMALGAVTLDNNRGQQFTDTASELANFICVHLRWELFMDPDFRPPAKLWVFQTLLLLETYEKMYSTRELHERAHIHHDTTLTLMRRGSSLIGRTAFNSPPSPSDNRQRSAVPSSAGSSEPGHFDESWLRWIKSEGTRRVAFAAFVLDSTHATMFGHSVKMAAHEMRLPLPCDENLWSATCPSEAAKVQLRLNASGFKPTMFLEGLKKTLTGQTVRTNAFGRTIIMAGLLSVSWHMNQRDLQVNSLGVSQVPGFRDKWRSSMLRAFDNWKRDFDESLANDTSSSAGGYSSSGGYQQRQQNLFEEDVFAETRNVLHHLAHMASHVDVVDCQIFAGAARLLGRAITPRDFSCAKEKMVERWANKDSARDATFFALKFLSQVLLRNGSSRPDYPVAGSRMNVHEYCAREDFIMSRPWVLYFAALVVWSYGFALDGPIRPSPPPELATPEQQRRDMYAFLERVGGVRHPNDLENIRDRNQCMGLLMVLRADFRNTRWELLHEAANLLGSCIDKLKGSPITIAPSL
ncbi:zinc finger protein zas1 [Nannizzia gypsea CBS 118893]|uniref:Zinc finger protein zas1 n=1 Tax=Arthroderma gypseum (strain ATCC MYA-4604 / CBS 118893) TaxID=535722 RepID=E4V3J5_ARTGP|nr:zinc finger protein zas1 [Nannizzia gypsea CBS 118893]EFR04569.1 zinc finger protein zas1 [Nannizzia gypsea CBS 118893]